MECWSNSKRLGNGVGREDPEGEDLRGGAGCPGWAVVHAGEAQMGVCLEYVRTQA